VSRQSRNSNAGHAVALGKEFIMNQSLPARAFREYTDLDQLKRQPSVPI